MRNKKEIEVGVVYGRLTVLKEVDRPLHVKPSSHRYVECVCTCGEYKKVQIGALRSGAVLSCGCYNREKGLKIYNGKSVTEYSGYGSWKAVIYRCIQSNRSSDVKYYSGRGITVCQRWRDPVSFAQDMGEKPKGFSIERIDNDKGYYPENCRWASPLEQGRNKSNNRRLDTAEGEKTIGQIWQDAGMRESTFYNRLAQGMTADEALSKPVRGRIPHVYLNGEKMMFKEAVKLTGISKYILRKKVQSDLTIDLTK